MKGPLIFALQLVVIEHGVLSDHDLRYGIREADPLPQAEIAFDHGDLRFPLRHDQVAGKRHERRLSGRRNMHDVDGVIQNGSLGEPQVRAVSPERSIQGHKRPLAVIRVARQMGFRRAVLLLKQRREVPRLDFLGQARNR